MQQTKQYTNDICLVKTNLIHIVNRTPIEGLILLRARIGALVQLVRSVLHTPTCS